LTADSDRVAPLSARSVEIASSKGAPRNNSANLIEICFAAPIHSDDPLFDLAFTSTGSI
jgi:hypothetical protein